ncbi:MAG: MFS transporter [Promethearchaeota archaeon]
MKRNRLKIKDLLKDQPNLYKHYQFLRFYSFWWWAFFGMIFVFQSIYFNIVGIEIFWIFLNAGISVVINLFITNLWSRLSDREGKMKFYIVMGNLIRVVSFVYISFVKDIPTMLIYTIIFNIAPNSDSIFISYIYKLSDFLFPTLKKERPIFQKIFSYAQVRKYGSIGWASMLPISGLIINFFGFNMNFFVAAIGLGLISLLFILKFDENIYFKELSKSKDSKNVAAVFLSEKIKSDLENEDISRGIIQIKEDEFNKKQNYKMEEISLFKNIHQIMKNNEYAIFMLVVFFVSIASAMNTTIFSIFNAKFSMNNFVLLGLTWSFNAFLEFPVMNIVSSRVEKFGWQNVIIFSYILMMIRLLLNLLLIFFNGTIIWIYFFQIINGIVFGLSWPATTYGLNENLDEKHKSLGMTFYNTIRQSGVFIGNILGALISYLIPSEDIFYIILFIIAASFSILGSLILYFKSSRKNKSS